MSPWWRRATEEPEPGPPPDAPQTVRREVLVAVDTARLPGELVVPPESPGIVIFAHGSGSGRGSPRNQDVARRLNEAGLATLLFDLLTASEAEDQARVFDVTLLARRLLAATKWLRTWPSVGPLPVAFFGASTGAAAALMAAAELGPEVAAIVSRGGRPDLAGEVLEHVFAPTLLVVGGSDPEVLERNREAQGRMQAETRLEVVPGATHLFEEPGALEEVARLALGWIAPRIEEARRERRPRRFSSLG